LYEYNAKIVDVVDGDTFDLEVDLGFKIFHKVRVRLLGIDTPEKRGNKEKHLGLLCTEYAKRFIGKDVVINSVKDTDINTDSFGRWLVHLYFAEDNTNILDMYNALGINKMHNTYSECNVEKLNALN